MFINLSNHPSNKCSTGQKAAPKKMFGKVVAAIFPYSPPKISEYDVAKISVAIGIILKCVINTYELFPKEKVAIHLMGEQTFCYAPIDYFDTEFTYIFASTK